MPKNRWSAEDDRVLRENMHLSTIEVGKLVGRTHLAVRSRVRHLPDVRFAKSAPRVDSDCPQCGKPFKALAAKPKRFCSVSCSNASRCLELQCLQCEKSLTGMQRRFCGNQCQQVHRSQEKIVAYLSGLHPGWTGKTRQLCGWLRAYIKNVRGSACEKCGWDKHHSSDGRSLTEINHKNGDAEDCSLENLEVVCPNCHSETSNFRARNQNSTRNRKTQKLRNVA